MRTPTVHLNGTSGDELLSQISEAESALALAINALMCAAPNARDYYVQASTGPATAFAEATREHATRVDRLRSVRCELFDIADAIAAQIEARKVKP